MRFALSLPLLLTFGCGTPANVEGDEPGECTDAADNDADGAFDCDDSDCAGSPDCGGDTADTGGGDTGGLPDQDPVCTEPVDPPCIDEMMQELGMQDDKVSSGEVTTTSDGADFVTLVDATAGGMSASSKNPWTYIKFTQTGAERVDINDDDSLSDMTWAFGIKRVNIRLNSGDSGPSCVGVHKVTGKDYAAVTVDDIKGKFETENFYDDSCNLSVDPIGDPETAMIEWWTYVSCVETTMVPWLVQLEDGHVLKVVVETYYAGEGQDECNTGGSTREEGGWVQLRWQYLK